PELRAGERRHALGRRALKAADLRQERVDLLGSVVVHDAGADRAALLEAQALHHLERVVVALPHGKAGIAKARRRLAGGYTVDVEREGRDTSLNRRQPVERDVPGQPGQEPLAER